MESVESQIAEWRAYVANAPGVNGRDVDELEDHLRGQIDELHTAGLADDEAFLVAVKRMGDLDGLSREYAREHSGRLWKQLFRGDDEPARAAGGWVEPLVFAVAAAVVDPGRTPRRRLPRRGADLVRAEPQSLRAAVPRRVLRPPAAARPAAMGAGGGAVRARRARGQPLPVGRGLVDRGARRDPPARRALVRRRLPVHGRHARVARAPHGFRPLHGRVVHLLRANRARGRGAHGPDRCDPRTRGGRPRPDRRVGAAVGSGGRRDRGRVARRVEAAGRREHGAGSGDALHAAVRGDAGRLRRRLRGDRSRGRLRPRPRQRLRCPAGGRPRARPVRNVRRGTPRSRRAGWTGSSWSPSSAPSCST